MKEYVVTIRYFQEYIVEAESELEAEDIAIEMDNVNGMSGDWDFYARPVEEEEI